MNTKSSKKWYLGRRDNPQLPKPYYNVYGQISQADKSKAENSVYGSMWLTAYETKAELIAEIERLQAGGYNVSASYNCAGLTDNDIRRQTAMAEVHIEYAVIKDGLERKYPIELPISKERYSELRQGISDKNKAWNEIQTALQNLAAILGGTLGPWSIELKLGGDVE